MKRIIYTGAFRFPDLDAASARVMNNIKLLRKLAYEVIVISWGGKEANLVRDDTHLDIGYIVSHDLDTKGKITTHLVSSIFRGRNAIRYIKRICDGEKIDFIIMYNPSAYFVYKMRCLSKLKGVKLVSDITEWYSPKDFLGWFISPAFWANEINMRFLQKNIAQKIVISSFLCNYYKRSINIIIPPLIDSSEAKWRRRTVVIPRFDGIRLIYAGHPENKDLLYAMIGSVIQCLSLGLRIQFLILGLSRSQFQKLGAKRWSSFSLSEGTFFFCGNVPQEDVPGYYSVSDFSLVIRRNNRKTKSGFPTKLVESLMSGCPVITNATSDIKDYIINGYNGFLLEDFSPSAIRTVLHKVTQLSTIDLELMRINSRRSAIENFDYNKYEEQMKRIF